MNSTKTKKAIRNVIQLHKQIVMDGGVSAFSPQYKSYLILRALLLKMFHLPFIEENIDMIFTYPLSPAIDLFEPVDEVHCRFRAHVIVSLWHCRVERGNIYSRRAGQGWTIEDQVDFVYRALFTKACEF